MASTSGREGQLAAEGAVSLLYTWSRKQVLATSSRPVASGRKRRRCRAVAVRVPFDDDDRLTGRSEAVAARRLTDGRPSDPADRRMRTLFRHPRRVWHVLAVFFRPVHRARPCTSRAPTSGPGPSALRIAFEQLGGAWVKLGQMLALRYDLLPVAYCDELFGLLNQVAPFSYDEVRAIIRQRARRRARGRVRDVRAASRSRRRRSARCIGRRLHNGDRGRGQGPAAAHPRDPEGRHRPHVLVTWLLDWTRRVRRRPRAARSSTSSRAGRRTRSTTSSRPARPCCSTSTRAATSTSESPASTATTRRRAS